MKGTTITASSVEKQEGESRLWWLIVARGPELELRRRRESGGWRMRCPVDDSHEVTLVNGTPGIALTCHGPLGSEGAGHSLAAHRHGYEMPYPCRFCGCTESMVLAALGARPRDKFPQAQRDGRCRCGVSGYSVGRLPVLCLPHLADHVGLARSVLFGGGARLFSDVRPKTRRKSAASERVWTVAGGEVVGRYVDLFNDLFERRVTVTPDVRDSIEEALASDYSINDILVACVVASQDPFLQEHNADKTLDPEWPLRFKGGQNSQTGKQAKKWLPSLLSRAEFVVVTPRLSEIAEKHGVLDALKAHGAKVRT